jgi:23S rRNA pseudouridine955/2504/2580 synthase
VTFKVLFEDENLIAVSKPCGWVVDSDDPADSLTLAVAKQTGKKVFPFHRIDRATSGIVLFGKTRVHAAAITQAFEKKTIRKAYLAVVEGEWRNDLNKVDLEIEGKPALTTFRILAKAESRTLIEALPKTGRTHQIRIHCASQGHSIVGDTFYDRNQSRIPPKEQALHAYRLGFVHPGSREAVSLLDIPENWRETYLDDFDWDAIALKLTGKKGGE